MANVYHSKSVDNNFLKQLKSDLAINFLGCKRIAVKIHFGEPGNTRALTARDIEPITKLLEELKFDYFLYDSSVNYGGERGDPKTHKIYAESKGFKNVETGDEYIEVKGDHLTYQVCSKLTDADAVLVITHVKGHVCTGFGGAIKNLGMGALTGKTKGDIHTGGRPKFNDTCIQCGECVRACPINGLVLDGTMDRPKINVCYGCSNCFYLCNQGAIDITVAPFDLLLAEGANAAQSRFKKYYYVSMIKNVSKKCDCESDSGPIIAKDAGWVMSTDCVAIDQASYDLIFKQDGETFFEHNKKKGHQQLEAAEALGMGSRKYVMKEV